MFNELSKHQVGRRFLLVKDILETTAQVGRLEQHSTKFGQSRFVTATQPKYRVSTESGVKKKEVSEVLRKYGVCVCVCGV
jgi:hypothetical protein